MWLRFDERTDMLASLTLCLMCLRRLGDDPALWKWAILSLHNALQGAMVCHLSGTAQLGALSDKSGRAWRDWNKRDLRGEIERTDEGFDEFGMRKTRIKRKKDYRPNERLADASELFERLWNENKRQDVGAGALLVITESERDSFRRLHDLRNEFSHFTPKGWSIESSGLPGIFLDILGVLEKIAADPCPFLHMDEECRSKLDFLLQELNTDIEKIRMT